MNRHSLQIYSLGIVALVFCGTHAAEGQESGKLAVEEGDYVARDFHFHSGETLAELRLHYQTLGKPARDSRGRVTNAVLILHGTSGSGRQFLAPQFAGVLFGPGQLLDSNRTYIILPDDIGHGRSTKPSDGLRMRFPQYDYADMVAAEHLLVTEGLGVNHLRLVMGTSMGCMHAWLWGEMHPDFMDALMPLACLPVPIAGRNRLWRAMVMDAIRSDPGWEGGNYTEEPRQGLRLVSDLFLLVTSAPLRMQQELPTPQAVDKYYLDAIPSRFRGFDANDLLYQLNASRDYDPSPELEKIQAPVMAVNSADDFINPPELGIAERQIRRVRNGRFVLIPAGVETHGHGTHTWAEFWKPYLEELLKTSAH